MRSNNFNPNIKLTYEFSEASITFLDLNVKLSNGKLQTSLYVKPTDYINTFTFDQVIPNIQKGLYIQSKTKGQQDMFSGRRLKEQLQPNEIMVTEEQLSRTPD